MLTVMADDIDDLLSCIEKKMNTKVKTWDSDDSDDARSSARTHSYPNRTSSDKCDRKHDPSDLSDILRDDDDDDDIVHSQRIQTDSNSRGTKNASDADSADVVSWSTSAHASTSMKKCFPVYIGGSNCTKGLSTTANKRACDQLRCTDCDFSVLSFDNVHWATNTDYLFLRNNMPDLERLRSKLKPKKGSRAYACQCRWLTASDWSELLALHCDAKWVCGRH